MLNENFDKYIRGIKGISKAVLNIGTVDKEAQLERIKICKKCKYLSEDKKKCKVCGCFIVYKTKLESESCPKGKW